ncbi:MAG TPA: hypothetical protein VIH99_08430 [Bdellovibrionota bacterium]
MTALSLAVPAQAGFRHPTEDSGVTTTMIESTHPVAVVYSVRMMPDRAADSAPSQSKALPAEVKKADGKKNAEAKKPDAPKAQQAKAAPQQYGPLPKAPALPEAERIGVPNVNLPSAASRDGLLTMKPEKLSLKGANRAQIHSFLRHARGMPFPMREFSKDVRSREIAQRYRAALSPTPYKSFRTAYALGLGKIGKIPQAPSPIQYENMVKRMDSLFLGLDLAYPKAVLGLWQLAESPSNEKKFQARDALFAGLLSARAGWNTPAALLYEESAVKRVDLEERYLGILWKQLDEMANPVHLEKIVSHVSPLRAKEFAPDGDKANFAMAKRMLLAKHRAPLALNPSSEVFAQKIRSRDLGDRFRLLALIGQVRSPSESKRTQAVATLKELEMNGSEQIQQEARLTLARAYLRGGAAADALALYRNVEKNKKNRLEVSAEQTYAEYLNGEYPSSLGKAVALQSPYFQHGFAPDLNFVEILSRKAMCDFGGAESAVRRFADSYASELHALDSLAGQQGASYYEELVSYYDLEQPMRHQRYLLQLTGVRENQKTMNQALEDLAKVDKVGVRQKHVERPEGWDSFASSMHDRWSQRAQELRKISAETALAEAAYLAKRLRHVFAQVQLLDLDISTSAAKNYNLQSALNFPAKKIPENLAEKDKLRWPFEDEIWEDEIDFMKAKNPSKCALAAAF